MKLGRPLEFKYTTRKLSVQRAILEALRDYRTESNAAVVDEEIEALEHLLAERKQVKIINFFKDMGLEIPKGKNWVLNEDSFDN
jgi:hypothetical protein